MPLKENKPVSRRVSRRLAFAYIAFFIPGYLLTFGLFYYFIFQYLEKRDRDVVESRLQQLQESLDTRGLSGFESTLATPKIRAEIQNILVYVSDSNGKTEYFQLPIVGAHFDAKIALNLIKAHEQAGLWYNIPSITGDEDALEAKTASSTNGYRITLGGSTDARDEILERMTKIFVAILVPLFLLSLLAAIFIAERILEPLNELRRSMSDIRLGKLSARAPVPSSNDDLRALTHSFNDMAEHNENLVKAIKETIDSIAHDLKTPITRIRISSEIALISGKESELRTAVEDSVVECDGLISMIHAILTMAEAEAKAIQLNYREFPANEIFSEVLDLYQFIAEEKNIKLLADGKDFLLTADKAMIKQVIANLVDNAIKYSDPGTIVHLIAEGNDTFSQITVKDSGRGIAKDEQDRIWERFFRCDKSRHEPGLGLGLSLARAFVLAHSGTIELESNLGCGSAFIVQIPIIKGVFSKIT